MDPNQYDFTLLLDADELKIEGAKYKVGKYTRAHSSGIEEIYYRNKTFDIFIQKTDVEARLAKKKKKEKGKSKREDDYDIAKRNKSPFDVYDHNGIQCPLPRQMANMLSTGTSADDDFLLKYWQSLATKFTGPDPAAGTKPEYRRFRLAPPEKGPQVTVYFTPLSSKATLGVNVTLLQTVIREHEKEANGGYGKWKLVACSYKRAVELDLKLVGTNFLHLYHAWMTPAEYAALWVPWKNPASLPFPFPRNNATTVATYKKIHKDINVGRIPVNGANICLMTRRMQTAGSKRSAIGDNGLEIMGISATDLNKLWGDAAPETGMHNSRSEWLHRSAFSFGGITPKFNLKSSDDPNNLIFGTAESNTDMIRAEIFIKGLLAQYKGQYFQGHLKTTTITAGNVARKDLGATRTAELPTFLSAYPWLCFQLKYTFKMHQNSSPLGCTLNAETTFDPWSLYVPLAIEPRMDTWLLSHLKAKLYKKPTKRSADHSFLDSVASSEMVEPEPSMLEPELDMVDKAWRAVEEGLEELVLPGLVIKNPTALVPPSNVPDSKDGPGHHGGPKRFPLPVDEETPVPSQGFVLQGGVELFGTSVVGQFEKWMGPLPEGVVPGIDRPRWERVTVPGDFHLSSILPPLKDTPYDFIKFRNVSFWHQNCEFDKTRSVGWHLDAEWVIDESCGVLYEVLRTILHVDVPVLQISAGLGWDQQWNAPFDVHSFTLEGVFAGLTLSPVKGLQLTSIGVRLLGIRGFELYPEPHTTLSYGFSIFGAMKIDVPGSLVPLDLHYDMGVESGFVNISAELSGELWTNALGIDKLTLEDVTFLTSFSLSSPWQSLSFSISASFWYLASQAIFSGQFSPGSGSFALSAHFDQFDLREIDTLFYTLFGDSLSLPDYDVHLGSAVLSIASGSGLSVALRDVQVAGHTAFDVAVSLSTSGVTLSGAVSSSKRISFGDVHVRDASLEISFWTEKQKKKVDLILTGTLEVDFLHATVTAAVHVYPCEKGIDWTVIAILSAQDKSIAISDIVPQIEKGSYLDLSLRNAMIVAASRDDPAATSLPLPRGCTVRQGIQVAAVIDSLPVLNDLLRGKVVSDLVLSAGWSKQTGFDLKILLPAATTLDFGSGIRSTPISLELRTTPLQLAVSTGIIVPVKESAPLKFTFILDASLTKASATGEMDGWWVKPFGVENLKIGPKVGLTLGIDYKLFLATGTPTDFGVAAGLVIGKVPARFAMKISENPQDELLMGELKNLDIADVIAFGRDLVKADIPDIPDLLKFEELYLYICPFGVKFGTTVHPAGFSFKASMLFFKRRANIECGMDKVNRTISLNGGIDNFVLGPLTVRGANGPRAELKCELGLSKQQLVLDGLVKLFEAQAQTYVNMQFLPDPTLKFRSLLSFGGVFTYELNAELLGSSDNLPDADFFLSSTFETHLIDYIMQQLSEQLQVARTAATNGLQAAQHSVEDARSKWHTYLRKTQSDFTHAQTRWLEHEQAVRGSNQATIDHWLNSLEQLEHDAKDKQSTFDSILAEVRDAAEQSSRNRASTTAKAHDWILEVTRQGLEKNRVAQEQFNEAEADRLAFFRTTEQIIRVAENRVEAAEREINNTRATIKQYKDAPFYHVWKKTAIAFQHTKLLGLEGEKLLAQKAVDVSRQAWENVDYVQKAEKAEWARRNLEVVRELWLSKLADAKRDQSRTDMETLLAFNQAHTRWNETKIGPEYVSWRHADHLLEAHRATKGSILDKAVDTIKGLVTSVEYLGYTGARALLQVAETVVDVPFDLAQKFLHSAEDEVEMLSTVFQAIGEYGANAVVIEQISLSGTLRGAVGLGGPHSQPVTAAVRGRILGQPFAEEVAFSLKDTVAFLKDLFDRVWQFLKNAAADFLSGVLQKVRSTIKFAPTPILPIEDSSGTELLALNVSIEERQLFEGLLPPALLLRKHAFEPAWSASDSWSDHNVTYIAPMIPVNDLPQMLPFSVARARFLDYRVKGASGDADQARQKGLITIPAGPFTTGPPM